MLQLELPVQFQWSTTVRMLTHDGQQVIISREIDELTNRRVDALI